MSKKKIYPTLSKRGSVSKSLSKKLEYLSYCDGKKSFIEISNNLNLDSKNHGWVKKKQMINIIKSNEKYSLKVNDLPIVISFKKNSLIRSFDKKTILKKNIPKGSHFISLNNSKKEKLIWIKELNEIAWLY